MVFADDVGSSRVSVTTPSASCSQRMLLSDTGYSSDSFDDGGDAHAAADAEGGQAVAQVAPLELVDERAQDHRAGGAQRVAHRDGATVDVPLLVVEAGVGHEPQ